MLPPRVAVDVHFQFLGGAEEVGRQGMLLEHDGVRLLFDYGFLPTKPPKYPAESPKVDGVLLTHAHLDHCGMVPWVCGHHRSPVLATPPTRKAADLMALDSLKISEQDGRPFPYDISDVNVARRCYDDARFGEHRTIGDMQIGLLSAGHIPGATMFDVRAGDRTLLFTGDINTEDTMLVKGCRPRRCDVLFMESTYAGKEHADRGEAASEFLDAVEDTLVAGGKVLVPAFALGRMQEIMLLLLDAGHDVWVDGMGKKVTEIFLEEPKYLRDPRLLRRAAGQVKEVYSAHGRTLALKGEVIVTTSGMLEGGPVLRYLEAFREEPKNALFLVGYQVEATNGRRLLDTGSIEVKGTSYPVRCQVRQFELSAHAGHSQLVDFVRQCDPETVVLMHGDKRELLAEVLSADRKVLLPKNLERVDLTA